MAAAGSQPSASLPVLHNIPQDMAVLFWNLCGAIHLAPMTIRTAMNYACQAKSDTDNYRTYAQKIRGKDISDEDWKKWCRFSEIRLQTYQNTDKMDTTDLFCLLQILLHVRETKVIPEKARLPVLAYVSNKPIEKSAQADLIPDLKNITEAAKSSPPSVIVQKQTQTKNIPGKKQAKVFDGGKYRLVRNAVVQTGDGIYKILKPVQILKNLRNATMHIEATARDPRTFCKLMLRLHELIDVTVDAYGLSQERKKEMKKMLDDEIDHISTANKKTLPYVCASLLNRGREETRELWMSRFSHEELMFDYFEVKRRDVFHPLNIRLRNGKASQVFSYPKIFEATENIVILSGAAGSGKTTILKNLTLQFFEPRQTNTDYLQKFNFLVYIDLEDRKIETLSEVVEEQFGKLCKEFTKEEILDALFCFDVLFLVDAFDEANSKSKSVLLELLKKVWKFNFPVIITTRPQAANQLRQLLSKKNVSSTEYEILPLTELKHQLEFLSKHESYLSDSVHIEEMQKCFSKLSDRVRDMFTDPVNLVFFCHLFKNRRSRILQLKKPHQVADEIFALHKTIIEKKLSDSNYSDLSLLIDDMLLTIGELAMKFMEFSEFSEDEILQFQRRCKKILMNDTCFSAADTQVFLSVVLKIQRPLAGAGCVTWKFYHKTIQERFASRYIKDELTNTNKSLEQILEGTTATKPQLLGTLQYVVQDLSIKSLKLLERRWPQLKEALQKAGIKSHEDWQRYMLSYPDVEQVAREAAAATLAEKNEWKLYSSGDIDAVALMLPHAQPRTLAISGRYTKLRGNAWAEVIRSREGDLRLDLDLLCEYDEEGCDDFLLPLHKSRCRLLEYIGSVATVEGVAALASVAAPEAKLKIWLLEPVELSVLQGKYKELTVYVKPIRAAGGSGGRAPLPANPLPKLIVWCTQNGSLKDLVHTVMTLAPAGNRFGALFVRRIKLTSDELKYKDLSNDNLENVARTLQGLGVRTKDVFISQHSFIAPYYRLNITDDLPASLAS